jgi:hypothetical protein
LFSTGVEAGGFTAAEAGAEVAVAVALALEGALAAGLVGVEVEVEVDLTSSFPTTDTLVCHSSNALNC